MYVLCITDDVYWNFDDEEEKEKSKNDMYLIPDKFSIKYFDDNIDEYLGDLKINIMESHYTFITAHGEDTIDLLYNDFNIFRKLLLSFRLLKGGSIALCVIYGIDEDGIHTVLPVKPEEYEYYGGYDFNIKEFEMLKEVFTYINNYAFENNAYMKVAVNWFNKIYHTNYEEEKLIYLCTSLESLFCKGVHSSNKGLVVGLSCSMLIGKNELDRKNILLTIKKLFKLRNDVVHGKVIEKNRIMHITERATNYIKQSIIQITKIEYINKI